MRMALSLVLSLVLVLLPALPAYAAPVRPASGLAAENPELIARVQGLVAVAAAAAADAGIRELGDGEAPSAAFAQAMVRRALEGMLLTYQQQGQRMEMDAGQVRDAAAQMLAAVPDGGFTGISADTSAGHDTVGAHIYEAALGEDGLEVLADVYSLGGFEGSAEDAPEESLTWLRAMRFTLIPRMEAGAGFALSGFKTLEEYGARAWVRHEGRGLFEVLAPDVLAAVPVDGEMLRLEGPGGASLAVRGVPGSPGSLAAEWAAQGMEIDRAGEGRAAARAPGLLRIAVEAGSAGGSLVLEMAWPPEMEREYSLYSLTVENSFIVFGSAIG
ncbi:MAG TPA: hypothetical protein VLA21_10460 [Candidatus Limnocylindria bacterium]|nr:hypothetical protein [Candidatus Limnocylindria bacterium]